MLKFIIAQIILRIFNQTELVDFFIKTLTDLSKKTNTTIDDMLVEMLKKQIDEIKGLGKTSEEPK